MTPKKTEPARQSRRAAEAEQFEARSERSPLGALQPDTDAEFTADGGIPKGAETGSHYVERIGHPERTGPAKDNTDKAKPKR